MANLDNLEALLDNYLSSDDPSTTEPLEDPEYVIEAVAPDDKARLKKEFHSVFIPHMDMSTTAINPLHDLPSDYSGFTNAFLANIKEMEKYYQNIVISFPLDDYVNSGVEKPLENEGTVLYNLYRLITKDTRRFINLNNINIIFSCGNNWFAVSTDKYSDTMNSQFKTNLEMIMTKYNVNTRNATGVKDSNKKVGAKINVIDAPNNVKEVKSKEELEDESIEAQKEDLLKSIKDAAKDAASEEELLDAMEEDRKIKELLIDLDASDYGKPKFSQSRIKRMDSLDNSFKDSTINGISVRDMIENPQNDKELEVTALPVGSPNDEWQHMQFINFNKEYNIDEDIVAILDFFMEKSYPVAVRGLTVEDTSTSMDYLYTYRVEMEDSEGSRFTITFDMPKFINDRFMMLRGNEKVISGQLINLPISKTDSDTVQIVSNYNKIFIYRYGFAGKSTAVSDLLIKALNKYDGSKIKINPGDYSRSADKYDLPIEYLDLVSNFNSIETPNYLIHFDQDFYYKNYTIEPGAIPFAVIKRSGQVMSSNKIDDEIDYQRSIVQQITDLLCMEDPKFEEIYKLQKPANKHMYSRAKIMSNYIPLVVVICNTISFNDLLNRAHIKYDIFTKRPRIDPATHGLIKFSDAYLVYELNGASSMLLNGLNDCGPDMYSIDDMNKKQTWIGMLDNFGGRILADGLSNFSELFVDPITREVCADCGLPTDYIDMLIYANAMLTDSSYVKHTNIASNRYRTTEIVAGHFYKVISTSYSDYLGQIRRGRKNAKMTMKRSAVIDEILKNPVTSDLSIMSPLLELEMNNTATFKGLSGLNTDRAYSLDKRTYDESMVNKLAMSTGFAENVGINRQTTMDMDIEGKRGYIKATTKEDEEDISITKRLSITEAVTPLGVTHDDPIRSAMSFIQTAKHAMPVEHAYPLLVTTGADEAMPYIVSDTFSFRAKEDGTVVELEPDHHMIVSYKSGQGDYISLKEEVRKNSDGGFYITIKLSTDMKKGQKFKKDTVLAYDMRSFSNRIGEEDNLAYNAGVLAKIAILPTDEGFEDSCVITNWLSEAMGTGVIAQVPVTIGANANVYNMVKPGDRIEEGEPLVILQDSISDKDAQTLLKNLTDTDFVSDLGRVKIKAKYSGVVQDIKVYRTCEISELSASLKKVVTNYEKDIKAKKSIYKSYNIPGDNMLDPDYAMTQSGKLKNVDNGVLIEFYIKYFDTMSVGDKLTFQAANKGTVKFIIGEGDEPYTEFRPDEKIHALASSRSFNARMVTSPIVSGAINKGLIELDRKVKEIMGITPKPLEDI